PDLRSRRKDRSVPSSPRMRLGLGTRAASTSRGVRPSGSHGKAGGVEAQHPVPDDLKPDTADLGRLSARRPIVDGGKCQKPASLRSLLSLPNREAVTHQNLGAMVSEPT